jgi:glycosyltransferase involved in cell wall biosynthesis
VICDAPATAETLAARWGVDARVIEPGVDAAAGVAPHPGRYVLYVGALEPRKGLDVLAAAWAQRPLGDGAELLVAGEGRVAVPGARMLGHVTDAELQALYAGALAVVLPSWLEGYGYPPLEGLAHGVPAIVTATGRPSPGTVVVPAGDAAALAQAMCELAADPARRARLAAAGAAALPTWDECAALLWQQIVS